MIMAFTVKGEYERLMKIKAECEKKSHDKWLGFECGCACGFVTRIEYLSPFTKYDFFFFLAITITFSLFIISLFIREIS